MSENNLRGALRRMGYSNDDMTPHGFRAMARTIMVEQLNVHPDASKPGLRTASRARSALHMTEPNLAPSALS